MTARDVQHRISELLDERGWSQTHLAKIVGVPTSTITDPYLVKVGDTKVKIRFANNGVSFEDAFENLLLMS